MGIQESIMVKNYVIFILFMINIFKVGNKVNKDKPDLKRKLLCYFS